LFLEILIIDIFFFFFVKMVKLINMLVEPRV
jgi:hypothetical protein